MGVALQSPMTLRLTAGAGVGFSGACGLPLGWRARKPLPCAIRSSADLVPGHERRAPVLKHHLLALGPSLRPHSVLLCASCFSSLDAAFSSLFSVSCTRKEKVSAPVCVSFCYCMYLIARRRTLISLLHPTMFFERIKSGSFGCSLLVTGVPGCDTGCCTLAGIWAF